MAWVRTVDESEAEEELAEIYGYVRGKRGKVANIIAATSLNPAATVAHFDLYMATTLDDAMLARKESEMLAVVVSAANGCEYCVRHHSEALSFFWRDEERVQALARDFRSIVMSVRKQAMAVYADKLTRTPDKMTEEDMIPLREAGLTDEEIVAVNLVVSYFNFVNRIALGLGVEFSEEEAKGYVY